MEQEIIEITVGNALFEALSNDAEKRGITVRRVAEVLLVKAIEDRKDHSEND